MKNKHSVKKVALITVTMLILISIALAAQFKWEPGETSHTAEVNDILPESLNVGQIYDETIEPDANEQANNENTEIAQKPSPGNEAKDVRVNGNVSRGTGISPTTKIASGNGGNSIANFWQNRKTWLQPVKGRQTADPSGGARYFGAPRADGRTHAAIDFIAPSGTLVYAMTDGKVIRTSIFFQNTSAVEVRNSDGTIARYCEIAPAISVNTYVRRGDVIGKIISNYGGTSMLHLEMYMGTSSGSLSQSNTSNYKYVTVRNYQRRSDLIDPTGAKNLPEK